MTAILPPNILPGIGRRSGQKEKTGCNSLHVSGYIDFNLLLGHEFFLSRAGKDWDATSVGFT